MSKASCNPLVDAYVVSEELMNQTNWERRVLLVLDREDKIEQPKEREVTPDEMSREELEIYQKLLGLSDAGLLSRSTVLQQIYKEAAIGMNELNETMAATAASYTVATEAATAFGNTSRVVLQNMSSEDLKSLGVTTPEVRPEFSMGVLVDSDEEE